MLHYAIHINSLTFARIVLLTGTDINVKDKLGVTPLMVAVVDCHVEGVRFLIDYGANAKCPGPGGMTALHFAAGNGDLNILDQLIGHCEINAKRDNGMTALLYAAKLGDETVVSFLLQHGAMIDLKEAHGHTALFVAAAEGKSACVKRLLAAGADVHLRDKQGETALHAAVISGHADAAKLLLDAGADVNATMGMSTPLHFAADNGDLTLLTILLDAGANVNLKNMNGITPLMAAVKGKIPITGINNLLRHGADLNAVDNRGGNALSYAIGHDDADLVSVFLQKGIQVNTGGDESPVFVAATVGDAKITELLIKAEVNVNCRNRAGDTPLHLAAQHGQADVAKMLLRSGADIQIINREKKTPETVAEESGALDIAQLIHGYEGRSGQ